MSELRENHVAEDAWWEKNYQKAVAWVSSQNESGGIYDHAVEYAEASGVDPDDEDDQTIDAFMDQTAKHQALDLLYVLGIDWFNSVLGLDNPKLFEATFKAISRLSGRG